MRHEPSALVGHSKHSMQLMCAHPFFRCAKQVNSSQPSNKRNMTVLEDRSNLDCELLAASTTFPDAGTNGMFRFRLCLQSVGFADHAAMRADRAFWPALHFQKLAGFIFTLSVFRNVVEVHWLLSPTIVSQK